MMQNALHRNMLADQMKTCAQQDVFLAQQMMTPLQRHFPSDKQPQASCPV